MTLLVNIFVILMSHVQSCAIKSNLELDGCKMNYDNSEPLCIELQILVTVDSIQVFRIVIVASSEI